MKRAAALSLLLAPALSAAETAPTFNRDVAPILFANCAEGYHLGGGAPFSLTTYSEVKKRAKLLAEVTTKRYMPP